MVGIWLVAMAMAGGSADEVLEQAAEAHGLTREARLDVAFTFRGVPHRIHLDGTDVRYERTVDDAVHRLVGDQLTIVSDGEPLEVEPARADALRRSLNSVAYFATLPRPLFDDAVIATALGRTRLADQRWDTVEVRFRAEGGGDDHEDVFRYWFDPKTHEMGFLAYTFAVNEGGVRLRRVVRRHEHDGVVLVDWANHGLDGPDHTIDDAVAAYERGELPQLSTIALEDVELTRLGP